MTLYFTNFKKDIKTLCIIIQLECFSIFICLSFSLSWFLSVCPFSSIYTGNLCSKKYMSVLTHSLFKALRCNFNFSAENAFNRCIITDRSFFSIKLFWLNPKSALNLIVLEFDNLDCIIIAIAICSWTYIECLLPLNNLSLSFLYFLICGFIRSLMFLTMYFSLISLSIRSYTFLPPHLFAMSEMQSNFKSVLYHFYVFLLQKLQLYSMFQH